MRVPMQKADSVDGGEFMMEQEPGLASSVDDVADVTMRVHTPERHAVTGSRLKTHVTRLSHMRRSLSEV